jgi:NAD(P)-dependent dehydrogenase (short-subunit alcohol dehydrogenase family)
MSKVALVTGGNRGIGREIVRQLAAKDVEVFLAARAQKAGEKVAAEIGKGVHVLELDVANDQSIARAAKAFGAESDRLDVLINNAGIYPDEGVTVLTITREKLVETFQTNTFGAIRVTQAFLPFLKQASGSRVINVSSGYGELDGLSANVPSYCLSKLTLNGVTLMLSQALSGIAVNSMCPGWVRTDMGGPNASRSVEQGADTAVWLALEAPHRLTGKFLRDRQEIDW